MLKLSISPEVETFRAELRAWLEKHEPPSAGNDTSLSAFVRVGRAWQQELARARFIGVHWPKEFGGRGLSLVEEAIIQEELVRVNAPQILGLFGLTMVGPVLIRHGSDAQRAKFLPSILDASAIWCQGFSEPGAGSDLAAIRTRGIPTSDGYLVSGQKVWTSFAHIADWCFLLCRTVEGSSRHQGLSYLLVDMKTPGITTRPLKQITGDEEFNEVFFDNVAVPRENLVGQEGDGWRIAISTLMYERVVLTFARQLQSEVTLRKLLEKHGKTASPAELGRLSGAVARACAVRALAYEHLLSYAAGAAPGPEGSMDKLLWSESFQAIAKLALSLEESPMAVSELDASGEATHRYLYSRGRTIAAGTSEIQRSIIAERVLGLPRG